MGTASSISKKKTCPSSSNPLGQIGYPIVFQIIGRRGKQNLSNNESMQTYQHVSLENTQGLQMFSLHHVKKACLGHENPYLDSIGFYSNYSLNMQYFPNGSWKSTIVKIHRFKQKSYIPLGYHILADIEELPKEALFHEELPKEAPLQMDLCNIWLSLDQIKKIFNIDE